MKMRFLNLLCSCALLLAACGGGSAGGVGSNSKEFAEADARRVNVFAQIRGQERPLPPGQPTPLRVGDSLRVDEGGYAILRFSDLVTVEILRQGDLQIRELSLDEQSPLAAFGQSAGTFANELKPGKDGVAHRLEIHSDFATITATGTRFLVVRELDTPLEWVWALDATADDLRVTAQGVTRSVPRGTAYWLAPMGPPSPAIEIAPARVAEWMDGLRAGVPQGEVGDALWWPADALLHTGDMTGEVAPGATLALGAISLALAAEGAAGPARYSLADCNRDGVLDLAMSNGKIAFDLRAVSGRVRAVDVTVTGDARLSATDLQVFNPANEMLDYTGSVVQRSNDAILSVRSRPEQGEQPFHFAELSLAEGCFLGISLTPPESDGIASAARPAIPEPICTVAAAGLNLRQGPSTAYTPPIRLLRREDQLIPLGRTEDNGWLRVQVKDDGSEGWVSANPQFVACAISLAALPVADAPARPATQSERPVTPTLAPPPQTTRRWQSPQLLSPPDAASFAAGTAVGLFWSALPAQSLGRGPGVARHLPAPAPAEDALLRDDEYYQVTIRFAPSIDVEWKDIHLVKENSFVVPAYLNSREMTWDTRYIWSVAVVQRPALGEVRLLSPASESRVFYWHLPAEELPPSPPDSPLPTATPTDTPPPPTATPTPIPLPSATPTRPAVATATPTETAQRPATATPTGVTPP
ncbi:MAG: SH3 domain-containing protein [Caldilineaceae bacterium]|nr:SH3 domain-containing protein [Caldilineaceae bacterium]